MLISRAPNSTPIVRSWTAMMGNDDKLRSVHVIYGEIRLWVIDNVKNVSLTRLKSLVSKLEQQATFTNTYVNESGSSIFDLKHVVAKTEEKDKPTCIAYDNVFE